MKRKCDYCPRLLMEIDYYGQRLIGCAECNRWGLPDDKRLIMEMPDRDLEALRKRVGGWLASFVERNYRNNEGDETDHDARDDDVE